MKNIALILLALCGVLYLLNKSFPDVLADQQNYLYIFQIGLVLGVVLLSVMRSGVTTSFVLGATLRWLVVALVLLTGYSYRYPLQEYYQTILGHVFPSMGVDQPDGSVMLHAGADGHFQINAEVNNAKVTFLVDTGATKVALTARDAKRIGIDLNSLIYDVRITTANGVSFFASVMLKEIRIGSIVMNDVDAYVGQSGLDTSLLGMSFLNRLGEYQATRDTLTLCQKVC
jgi:aspartyl protease family protein